MIAWTPLLKPQHIPLVAISCSPQQRLNREIYLHLLSDRIQGMVDKSPDPQAAVKQFQEALFAEGMVSDMATCPIEEVGQNLVLSNPDVWEKLSNLGVFQKLLTAKPPLVANLMAHQALTSDQDDPTGRLLAWASRMGQVP
jgi:hypothetical protein